MKSLLTVVAIAACAASSALAQDQTSPTSPQSSPQQNMHSDFMDACGNDMKTYCASAQSRDERRSCMMANKDKFSDTCKTFMANHPMHQHQQGGQMQGPDNSQPH